MFLLITERDFTYNLVEIWARIKEWNKNISTTSSYIISIALLITTTSLLNS